MKKLYLLLISFLALTLIQPLQAQTNFGGLGADDSGGTGFKTLANNSNLVVSNIMTNDGNVMYTSQEGEVFTIKAYGVDDFTFEDMTIYGYVNTTANSASTVVFKDKNGTTLQTMTLNADKVMTTTWMSVASFFDNGTSLPIANVAEIFIDIKTPVQNYTKNFTYADITISLAPSNTAPTLTSVTTLTGATEDQTYEISYAALTAAANEADSDGDAISFRVEAISSGTLTKGGSAVTPGSTLLSSGESWVWTPAANANGTLNAFTVKAWDGTDASSSAVQVSVSTAADNDAPTLTSVTTLTGATEDQAFTISYATLADAANESDIEGDAISFRLEAISTGTLTKNGSSVTPGSTLLSSGESWVWTPASNANGTLSAFTIKAWDGTDASSTAVQVSVSVEANPPGNALDFDGTDDYVTTGAGLVNFANDMTIEAWFNTTNSDSYNSIATIEKTLSGVNDFLQILTNSSGNIYIDDANNAQIITTESYNDGRWHHVAFVRDATAKTIYLYVDGDLKGSETYTYSGAIDPDHELRFGNSEYQGGSYQMDGMLDEIRIWDDVRTEEEINANMDNPLVGDETGLLAYYNFDETSGTNLPDITGNGNNGTLNNMSDDDWVESYALVYPISADITTYDSESFTFSWTTPETGTVESYYIDIDDNANFSSPLASYDGLDVGTNLSKEITGLNPATTYYARVRAYKLSVGNVGAWSEVKSVTTTKADQTITFGTLTDKTYGDADFDPGATASSGLTVTYSSSNTDIATIVSGKIHIVGTGTCTIYADQTGNTAYNAANQESQSLTINKATPSVTAWPSATEITYGQDLSSATLTGGTASIAGSFAYDDNTITPSAGTYSADVTFTPTDAANYNTVAGNINVTVGKATPTITAWPTAASITYGEDLSSAALSGGTASVAGSFAYDDNTITPSAGIYSADVTFTPTDASNYNTESGNINITVGKATPTVTAWPTAASITYGEDLSSATLSGGTASVAGSFNYDDNTIAPSAGTYSADVIFTPTDATNYNTVAGNVNVTVGKATPTVTAWPAAASITYGEDLSSATLSGGTASVAGSFNYDDNTIAPSAGTYSADVIFTPTDATNYNTVTGNINVTVGKATPTVTAWPTAASITYGEDLSSAALSGGTASVAGSFNYDDNTITPSAGTYSADVIFTPTDATNYNTVAGNINVTVGKATPTVTAWPTATSITYGDNLSFATLSGGTASVAGSFDYDDNTITPNAGTYSADVTFTPTDASNYNTESGNTDVSVAKATLEATADDKLKTYGDVNPVFTITYSGFVNSEDKTVIDTKPTITCDADETSDVGTYDIVISGGSDDNYEFSYVNGILTINASTGIITIRNEFFKLYPNPVIDRLQIKSADQINIKKILIVDLLGKVHIIKEVNNYETEIDLNTLPQGAYLIQLISENKTITKRIIKE